MIAALSSILWTLVSTVIVFSVLFLFHFLYLTPKRMICEGRKLHELDADRFVAEKASLNAEIKLGDQDIESAEKIILSVAVPDVKEEERRQCECCGPMVAFGGTKAKELLGEPVPEKRAAVAESVDAPEKEKR